MSQSAESTSRTGGVVVESHAVLQPYRDLRTAFVEESALAFRYLYYAQIAEIEGHSAAARFFRDAADGIVMTTHGSLDFLREGDPLDALPIGDTGQNLKAAIAIETEEATILFPDMSRRAREFGLGDVASWLDTLARLKRSHIEMLTQLQQSLSPKCKSAVSGMPVEVSK